MNNIIQQVQNISSSTAIEAAKIVASSIAEEPLMNEIEFEKEFGDPLSHINEMDQFARLILINAAEKPEYEYLVQQAIANSGRKQLVLGGMEIIALAAIGLAALRIIVNPVTKRVIKSTDKDGNKIVYEEHRNNDTDFLAKLIAKIFAK